MDYIEAIVKRKSVRTFVKSSLEEQTISQIEKILKNEDLVESPFGNMCTFDFIEKNTSEEGVKAIGTYGFIKNSSGYIIGMCKNSDRDLVDFGYIFEHVILELTQIGIGTCWLGGTFKRKDFEGKIMIPRGYIIPAITPLGIEAKSKSIGESLIRKMAKSNKRKKISELFFHGSFQNPMKSHSENAIGRGLKCIQIGPSASNKQPWRIVVKENEEELDFYVAFDENYTGNKLGFNMQYIDMGIAMKHFDIAMKEQGVLGFWKQGNEKDKINDLGYKYVCTWIKQ